MTTSVTAAACAAVTLTPLALSLLAARSDAATGQTVSIAPTDRRIRYRGRFDLSDPAGPRCSWSASAVELRYTGTGVDVVLNDSGDSDAYQVVIDGAPVSVLHPKAGTDTYSVYRSSGVETHTVQLVKRTEGFFGVTQFRGFALPDGGALLRLPSRPAHRIEVIGDSISCGYGNEAKDQKEHFSSANENAYLSYGAVAARMLDADYTCVAWSGRTMWPKNTMGEVYDRILAQDPNSRWDYHRWTPDVVVITLGTNDFAGGIPDRQGWITGYGAFLTRVRKNYPKAAIYCATSPMMFGTPYDTLKSYLEQIIRDERASGDANIRLLLFQTQDAKNGFGADWHPSVKTDQEMAETMASTLQHDLGWQRSSVAAVPTTERR